MSLFPEVDEEIKKIKEERESRLQELILNSTMYYPSNGSDGDFLDRIVCSGCGKKDEDNEKYCEIWDRLYGEKCKEIREVGKTLFCIGHSDFNIDDYVKRN